MSVLTVLTSSPPVLALAGLLGAALGSFIHTRADGPSSPFRRSACNVCRKNLGPLELVPVFSYVFLGGKCAGCKGRIPWRYPVVEAVLGILFVLATVAADGNVTALLRTWFVLCVFTYTFLTDALRQDVSPLLMVGAAAVLVPVQLALGMPPGPLLLGALVGGGFFAAQHFVSKGKWVGLGDAWIGLALGVLLGFPGVLAALLIAYASGAAVAVTLLAAGRMKRTSTMAFGPFLVSAGTVVLLWGPVLTTWYWRLTDAIGERLYG